jgi:plastocyanin
MRVDRSADLRKPRQQWNDKLTQPPSRAGGDWKWVILGGALVGLLLVGAMAFVLFVSVERQDEAARRQQAVQLDEFGRALGQFDAPPPDWNAGPPSDWAPRRQFITPSAPDSFGPGPPVDYSSIPGAPKTPWDVRDGTSNTFVFPGGGAPPGFRPQVPDGWGHVKGRFVVVGEPPTLPPLKITGDDDFVRQCDVRNESVVVGQSGELANVVVYLAARAPAVHPDYAQAANAEVVLKTEKCRFEPRVCLLRPTQTLKLVNADPVAHQPHAYLDGQGWSAVLKSGEPQTRRLGVTTSVGLVECDDHRWMRGWVLVRDDPYMAVTGRDGAFEIKNLPGGVDLVLEVWHEAAGSLSSRLDNAARFSFVIPADKTHDLGTIDVPAELLKPKRGAAARP